MSAPYDTVVQTVGRESATTCGRLPVPPAVTMKTPFSLVGGIKFRRKVLHPFSSYESYVTSVLNIETSVSHERDSIPNYTALHPTWQHSSLTARRNSERRNGVFMPSVDGA